jgi:hypothetical protein
VRLLRAAFHSSCDAGQAADKLTVLRTPEIPPRVRTVTALVVTAALVVMLAHVGVLYLQNISRPLCDVGGNSAPVFSRSHVTNTERAGVSRLALQSE